MSDIFDGGPAFPVAYSNEADGPTVMPSAGMTLRDYFIAHAPAEPQPWFRPVMPEPHPEKPAFPQSAGTEGERSYVREFDIVMKPDEVEAPELRDYVVAIQAYQPIASAWSQEEKKQRYVQWPAAWADAMLAARSEPQPVQYRALYPYEQEKLNAADRLAAAVEDVKKVSAYLAIPADIRQPLERALEDVTEPTIPF